ncbi:class I SAM-dependent methyltransferase [Mycobacterium sp.]|jgi:O-methyltransferase involved in polyketide biosynthesis|uniref:class I SAM-dependent methyltransferase n=1 Tax=Mycobacterium sp. TaxID=1785 RepID=UPI002F08529D
MTSSNGHRADVTTLTGVSETALLTLNVRAREARRPDAIIEDPMAIKLVDSIDYDFAKFGPSNRQDVAVRALAFDHNARRYLAAHPHATVVALAEGLQTSFWRLDEPGDQFHWLTVDLPRIIELRRRLLPRSPRISERAQSALDFSWMDDVDPAQGVFVTAEGLLMYLQPDEAMGLIRECARRFAGGQMMFDLPPRWAAALARHGFRASLRYKVPPMPFSLSLAEIADLVNTVPGIRAVHDMPLPRGRGPVFNLLLWTIQRLPLFDPVRPAITLLEFG